MNIDCLAAGSQFRKAPIEFFRYQPEIFFSRPNLEATRRLIYPATPFLALSPANSICHAG